LGFVPSSPTQAKDFLYRFHQRSDGQMLTDEDDAALSVQGKAQIRPEGPALRVLGEILCESARQLQSTRPRAIATIDIDATIVESNKKTALWTYDGVKGFQPQMAYWSEHGMWLSDQFRDGNVPAEYACKEFIEWVFGLLPKSVAERRFRGDAAMYNRAALTYADNQGILFAVSADMSEALHRKCRATDNNSWKEFSVIPGNRRDEKRHQQEERQWAEICDFVPEWERNRKKHGTPLRYLALRVRSRQRSLVESDQQTWKYFAVVTNMDWDGERLLRWQREKQGTVEHGHRIMKDELGAGTLPCGRFGASAAWWRINALCHNLLQFMKTTALPKSMHTLRPKRMRFRLLNMAGLIVRHARQLFLKLSKHHPAAEPYAQARKQLAALRCAATT
jgi:hypothetical protein